jgi:hypothetical protein
MPKFAHKATDHLSEAAWQIILAGFAAAKTYRAIVAEVKQKTGERVAERTLARRAVEWRREEARRAAAREHARNLVAAVKENNLAAPEILVAMATDQLLMDPDSFRKADPIDIQRTNLEAEKLRIKREELEVKKRQVAIDEQKLALIKDRQAKLAAETERLEEKAAKGEQLTTEEIARIRQQVYGLTA